MRPYGLQLFMARDLSGVKGHDLVVVGPGLVNQKTILSELGFSRDERFTHKEYWRRPIAGMTHRIIKDSFPEAALELTDVVKIMPALKAKAANVKSAQQALNKQAGDDNDNEFGHARSVSEPAARRTNDAGNEGYGVLGQPGASDDVKQQSVDADKVEHRRNIGAVPDRPSGEVGNSSDRTDEPVEDRQPLTSQPEPPTTNELEQARENVSTRDFDSRAGERDSGEPASGALTDSEPEAPTDQAEHYVEEPQQKQLPDPIEENEPVSSVRVEATQPDGPAELSTEIDDADLSITADANDSAEKHTDAPQAAWIEAEVNAEQAGPSVDREWQGMSLAFIEAQPKPRFTMGADFYTQSAFKALEKAEKDGFASLSNEQKSSLMGFKGWGGVYQDIRTDNGRSNRNSRGEEISASLGITSAAYNKTIGENRLESYYTPPAAAKRMWSIFSRAGLSPSSKVLDPGCGAAHLYVCAPEPVQRHANLVGLECDPFALRMARVLAPDARFVEGRYESTILKKDFDAVIGNVPFGETRIKDKNYPESALIHDYFILRSLDQMRDGGLMVVMTSSGTMDKESSAVREQMMDRADLVAGFRLPHEVFTDQNAKVTTDILVLRKRPKGTAPAYDFTKTSVVTLDQRDGETVSFPINSYYLDNPENILGELTAQSGAFGPSLATTVAEQSTLFDTYAKFDRMIEQVIEPDMLATSNWIALDTALDDQPGKVSRKKAPKYQALEGDGHLDDYDGFVGDFYEENGEVRVVVDREPVFDDDGVEIDQRFITSGMDFKPGVKALVLDYITLRDATRQLVREQITGDDDALAAAQETALTAYNEFVAQHGPVNSKKIAAQFIEDPGAAEVLALEMWDLDEEVVTSVSDIFSKRVVAVGKAREIKTVEDAYFVCLDQFGKINIEHIAGLVGESPEEVAKKLNGNLIFIDHETRDWVSAESYLSGNVVKKLEEVTQSLNESDEFKLNYEALSGVQPKPIPYQGITINLGANWVPEHFVREFVESLFDSEIDEYDIKLRYSKAIGEWTVDTSTRFKNDNTAQRTTLYGTELAPFEQLLEMQLNSKKPSHYFKDAEGKSRLDSEKTNASRAKQEELTQKFSDWLGSDPARVEAITEHYNKTCNTMVVPNVSGHWLTFPGLSPDFIPMPHQLDFVARGLQGVNALAAHTVGAGKTFEMVALSIKQKQLGMLNKPMIAVPNHMLLQMTREVKSLFPSARVLMVNTEDLQGVNRKRFLAIARNNDWDIVVCTHSMLNDIRPPAHIRENDLQEQIDLMRLRNSSADSKRMERRYQAQLKSLQSELEALREEIQDEELSGRVLTIDQIGVDGVSVDEAQAYKNLQISSSLNVAGITTGGSKRAQNMLGLANYFREYHGRSYGVNYFTGTPISNSMCEMYVINRVLRPELLEEAGLYSFDEWAKWFGKVASNLEALPEGGGFRVNERFTEFVNAPEMIKLFRTFTDVKSKADLNLPTPKVNTIVESYEQTQWQKLFMQHLTRRAVAIRGGKVRPEDDNMLALSTAGRKAALDMRLIDRRLPNDATAKLAGVAKNIARKFHDTMEQRGTQLVFFDIGTPGKKKPYSSYETLKEILVAQGIPAKEIAFVQEAKSKAALEAMFAAVRNGEIRVLIGSTEKMGAGTNVQDRLCALHNVDCPWRPSDIEQRIGRIARRGNKFFDEVEEFRYTTQDSFDLFMWETNKRKQDFINQAMSDPDSIGREISEELDMGHAEVLAVTTGEPRVKEKVMLDSEVGKMERARRAWEGDKINRYTVSKKTLSELERAKERLDLEMKVASLLPLSRYKVVEVDGETMGVHEGPASLLFAKEAGEVINARIPMAQQKHENMKTSPELGVKVGGIELVYNGRHLGGGVMIGGAIGGKVLPMNQFAVSKTPSVTGRGARDWFNTHERQEMMNEHIAGLENTIRRIGSVDFNESWPREAEFQEAVERKRELDRWFAAQDFNKVQDGPDPYLLAIQELNDEIPDSDIADKDDLLEVNTLGSQGLLPTDTLHQDLFTDKQDNDTKRVLSGPR